MTPKRIALSLAAFVLVSPLAARALPATQSAAPPAASPAASGKKATITVQVPVTLRDKKGHLLTTYPASDLTLSDNGHPQTIQSFDHPQNEPLRIGLLLDTTSGQQDALDSERAACARFVDQMLQRPNTKIFLLHFDHEVELLQDFTNSAKKLRTELSQMTSSVDAASSQQPSGQVGTVGKAAPPAGAEVYDAVYLAARELFAPEHGRKLMVVFTNGYDRNSKVGLNEAIDAAQRAQVSVFTLYVKGEGQRPANSGQSQRPGGVGFPGRYPGGGYPGGGYPGGSYPGGGYPGSNPGGNNRQRTQTGYGDGRKTLEQIAVRSGGRYFEDIRKSDYDDVFHQIADELNAQFALIFTPNDLSDDSFSDGFHKISLRAKDKSMFVVTTEGYFEPSSDTAANSAGK